jgi:uncharacterized integral membrane protein
MTSNPRGTVPDDGEAGGSGSAASDAGGPQSGGPGSDRPEQPVDQKRSTRLGMIWTATVVALILLVLLIIFVAQNQDQVMLRYFGFEGQVALGLALFVAAVAGGLVVAAAGAARIIQLRYRDRRIRKNGSQPR